MMELVRAPGQDTTLTISDVCQSLALSRASFYRRGASELSDETGLRDAMQRIALEMPCYGYRRITHELRRQGHAVNHKHVLRLMRQDNLLCLRTGKFLVTTDSEHGRPVYPNRAAELLVTGVNQLWVADITYLRLRREFVYLAVLLDVYSRRCIGWELGRRLTDELALAALRRALESREIRPGLVHHSDRGVQYASIDYTQLLTGAGIAISMSRRGNPYDNAKAESFIKTLKYEEVYLSEYEDFADAWESIEHFIEAVYNGKRLHSALGYLPPAEFEQQSGRQTEVVSP